MVLSNGWNEVAKMEFKFFSVHSNKSSDKWVKWALINDCRIMMGETSAGLTHILNETNKCADKLAHLEACQWEQCIRILVLPDEFIDDLIADMQKLRSQENFNYISFFSFVNKKKKETGVITWFIAMQRHLFT